MSHSDNVEPQKLNSLLDAWNKVEAQFSSQLTSTDANLVTQTSGNLAIQLDEAKLAALEAEQHNLLNQLSHAPASSLSEIIGKLEIWRATTCPETEDEAFLQPVDRLVLSILKDLRRLET